MNELTFTSNILNLENCAVGEISVSLLVRLDSIFFRITYIIYVLSHDLLGLGILDIIQVSITYIIYVLSYDLLGLGIIDILQVSIANHLLAIFLIFILLDHLNSIQSQDIYT